MHMNEERYQKSYESMGNRCDDQGEMQEQFKNTQCHSLIQTSWNYQIPLDGWNGQNDRLLTRLTPIFPSVGIIIHRARDNYITSEEKRNFMTHRLTMTGLRRC